MVSVAVAQVSMTELIFINPGVNVNGQYYCDVLLSQQMLPAIKRVAERCLFTKQYVACGEIGMTDCFWQMELITLVLIACSRNNKRQTVCCL